MQHAMSNPLIFLSCSRIASNWSTVSLDLLAALASNEIAEELLK